MARTSNRNRRPPPAPLNRRQRFKRWWSRAKPGEQLAAAVALTVGVIGVTGALVAVLVPLGVTALKEGGPGYTIRVFTDPSEAQFGKNYISGLDYVFPAGALEEVSDAPEGGCSGAYAWVHKNGGIDAGTTVAAFVIASQSKTVVVNTGRVVVDRVIPMPAAVDLLSCPQGGPIADQILSIDLDSKTAELSSPSDPDDPSSDPQSYPFALLIEPGKADRIYLAASTDKVYVEWHLELLMDIAGKPVTKKIDNNGKPFVTAPLQGAPAKTYIWADGEIRQGR